MTQSELVTLLANKTGSSEAEALAHLHAFRDVVHQEVQDGNEVQVPGLGKFHVTHVKARAGKNPQTGESLNIPAHNAARFKASAALKRAASGLD